MAKVLMKSGKREKKINEIYCKSPGGVLDSPEKGLDPTQRAIESDEYFRT